MIVRRKDGYHVLSEGGKHLGGPFKTRGEAERRLAQIEWFKTHKAEGEFGEIDPDRVAELADPEVSFFDVEKAPATSTQSVVLSRETFKTRAAADRWIKDHGYKIGQVDETATEWRYRQIEPSEFDPRSFRSFALPGSAGVRLIIGRKK